MKQKVIISAAMAAMILLPTALRAQDLSSGYFVEDYTYRYQMNPAFGNSQNFISMPALGNLNVGTFGASFGWVANLHLTGFNFFLGMDRVPGKLCKQGVPLSSNAQVTMGINFPF